MVKTSLISVVMPSYNHGHMIGRAISSVILQTWQNFEILVIDNHSTDNTEEVVRAISDPRIHFIKIHNNGVIAASRNLGIKESKGKWIAFLDSDDWWMPEKLELSFSEILKGADFVYHDLYIAKKENQSKYRERIHSSSPKNPMFESLLCTGMSIPNSSVLVNKNILELAGGLCEDPLVVTVEDYDMWIRVAKITERFVRLPKVMGYYWAGGGNMSAASKKQIDRIEALYSRHIFLLNESNYLRAEGFLKYRIARLTHLSGDIKAARNLYFSALFSKIDFIYKIKALFFCLKCILKRF